VSTGRQPLRVMETFRIVFYTPIYVAVAGGYWEAEGLDVSFTTCGPPYPHAFAALNQDAADIAQSGIMRSIIASDWGAETVPVHIAKINARDGFLVLSRRPQEQFQWESLKGATVIPVGFSPMPWASFQFALRRHGVEPEDLDLVPGLSLDQAIAAFLGGQGDFIHLPQPAAESMLSAGQAHLAVALGPENGHIAYSSFAATNRFLDARPEAAGRFVLGFARALKWLSDNDAATVGETVARFFPDVDEELIVRSVQRYKQQETWPTDPRLEPPEFDGLQKILVDAGLVKDEQAYHKIVRPEFAQAVVS
jgi:NitT/TauT family transport system substrate-binding protein